MSDSPELSCTTGCRLHGVFRQGESWTQEPCVLGIDEAGRGPVLGPMVYAACFAPCSTDLAGRAFADSKTLTPEQRDGLFDAIAGDTGLGYVADILSAAFISESMLARDKVSLNALAFNSTCKMISAVLDAGVKLTQVFVDTVGDPERYAEKLVQAFPALAFTVCPKADALYPVVSAASIVAKVTRDRALLRCMQDLGLSGPLGSGYPSDPDTKAWLKANVSAVMGFPPLVRFSWETCTRSLEEDAVGIKWQADEDADAGQQAASGQQQRLNFASASGTNVLETSGLGRAPYFRYRKLQRLADAF